MTCDYYERHVSDVVVWCVRGCAFACEYEYICVSGYLCVFVSAYMHACVCVYVCLYVHVCMFDSR